MVSGGIGRVYMQDTFTKGMQNWFALKEFQVGIPTEDMDENSSLKDFLDKLKSFGKLVAIIWGIFRFFWPDKRGENAGKLAGTIGSVLAFYDLLIDTKTTAADFYNALKPYVSKADLVGLKISNARGTSSSRTNPENRTFLNTVLVLIIYADQPTPASILQQFDEFLVAAGPLKRLGLRAKFLGNRASIYPLLVYFDSKKLEEDKGLLWPHIFEECDTESMRPRIRSDKDSWTPEFRAKLSAGVVDVSEKWVLSEIFDKNDLNWVLKWGESDR